MLLVIIDDFDRTGVAIFPAKADPPLIVDSDAVLASSISGQLLQVIGRRDPEITEPASGIQDQQFPKSDPMNTREPLGMPPLKNLLGFLTAKPLNHVLIITHRDNNVKRYQVA